MLHASPHTAIVRGWLYVPLAAVGGQHELEQLKARLTHLPKFADKGEAPLCLYDLSLPGHIGVPRPYGAHRFQHLPVRDETTLGMPMMGANQYRRPNPYHPSVLDPVAQAKFMAELAQSAREYETFLATAPTGSGKTVSFIDAAIVLARKTAVFVPLERLMHQWAESLRDICGVPENRIGFVQGPRCEYQGRDFVIGMLPSLNLRDYPREFYNQFGLVGFDEVHRLGSDFFARSAPRFPARYKIGLSATLDRADGGDRVFVWHLGPIRVRSTAVALPMDVRTIPYSNRGYNPRGKFAQGKLAGVQVAKALSQDTQRNRVILAVIERFYHGGRQALIVGASVAHLQTLMEMAAKSGIPREAMGQFTAEAHHRELTNGRVRKRKRKLSDEELSFVKENSQLVFATYGMLTEGIDIPRLDAGIDVTPEGKATQLVGRIRRPRPGKKRPLWVTLKDTDCPLAMRRYESRCRDYLASNATVLNHGTSTVNVNSRAAGAARRGAA